ncbi:MAG: hypothetical protein GX868_04510 [Actinobacteria bacterium]|nr:hypothetical protein [Actinomycetota bacterium]
MSRSRRPTKKPQKPTPVATRDFWGSFDDLPEGDARVSPASDPASVVTSLGSPPLAGHEQVAEHYFRAIYERAGGLAFAIAAGNGIIADND